MVKDGAQGTSSGDGLKRTLASSYRGGAQGYYVGARKYNSGTVNLADLSEAFGANSNYAIHVANRPLGVASLGLCHSFLDLLQIRGIFIFHIESFHFIFPFFRLRLHGVSHKGDKAFQSSKFKSAYEED